MGEPFLSDFKLMRRRYEQIFRKIIEDGIAKGIFRNIDAAIAARTLLSATNWTYESYGSFKSLKSFSKLSPKETSDLITTILIEGIITR